jgi:hypothetical protein
LHLELHSDLPFFDGLNEFIQSFTDIKPRIIGILTGIVDDFLFGIFFRIEFDDSI